MFMKSMIMDIIECTILKKEMREFRFFPLSVQFSPPPSCENSLISEELFNSQKLVVF